MSNLLLIYNPYSGTQFFKNYLDEVIDILQNKGKYSVTLYRMSNEWALADYLDSIDILNFETVCISGGDGTINIVLNELSRLNYMPKIGLFPSGTANDFCSNIGLNKNPIENAEIIASGIVTEIDYGIVNNTNFINVICVGVFAEVSQGVDPNLKHNIGKLAYYVHGAKVLANINPINVRITTSDKVIEEKTYLILVLNGDRAGGFKLAPLSEINDGSFDLVLFRAESYQIAAAALLKVLSGNHVNDNSVLYLQSDYFKIECVDNMLSTPETDIDGEKGPTLPLEIKVMENKLKIFI